MFEKPKEDSILNKLARNRTVLANERTFLAYIRTSIMFAISGVTLIKFFSTEFYIVLLGYLLLPVALINYIVGNIRYHKMIKRISETEIQKP
jgi:putative membrane protein